MRTPAIPVTVCGIPSSLSCDRRIPALRTAASISGSWQVSTGSTGSRSWNTILPARPGRRRPAASPCPAHCCGRRMRLCGCVFTTGPWPGWPGSPAARPVPPRYWPWIRPGRKAGAVPPFSCPAVSWPISRGAASAFTSKNGRLFGKAEELRHALMATAWPACLLHRNPSSARHIFPQRQCVHRSFLLPKRHMSGLLHLQASRPTSFSTAGIKKERTGKVRSSFFR